MRLPLLASPLVLACTLFVFTPAAQAAGEKAAAGDVISRYCKAWLAFAGGANARPMPAQQRPQFEAITQELNDQAQRGDAQAQYAIGSLIAAQSRVLGQAGQKAEANAAFNAAANLFAASAEQGFPLAMLEAYKMTPTSSPKEEEASVNRYLKPAAMHGVFQAAFFLYGHCMSAGGASKSDCTAWQVVMRDVRLLYPPAASEAAALQYHAQLSPPPDQSAADFQAGLKLGAARALTVAKNRDTAVAKFPMLRECGFAPSR